MNRIKNRNADSFQALSNPAWLTMVSFLLFLCSRLLHAQDGRDDVGNWVMYFGQNKISSRWSVHSELQWRNYTISPRLEQFLVRGGINYNINVSNMVSSGYGYIVSEPYEAGLAGTIEHRIWEQFIMKNSIGRCYFDHRYRYEQRWVGDSFMQRARYRLAVSIPLNSKVMNPGTMFLFLYNEMFINLQDKIQFDRNRLYGAVGHKLSPIFSIQLGVLSQTVPIYSKTYLQLGISFDPDFSSKDEQIQKSY